MKKQKYKAKKYNSYLLKNIKVTKISTVLF